MALSLLLVSRTAPGNQQWGGDKRQWEASSWQQGGWQQNGGWQQQQGGNQGGWQQQGGSQGGGPSRGTSTALQQPSGAPPNLGLARGTPTRGSTIQGASQCIDFDRGRCWYGANCRHLHN